MKAIQYRSTTARTASLIFPSLRLGMAKFSWQCGPLASTHSITRFARATSMGQRLKTSHASGQTGAGAVVASKSDAFNVGNRVFVRGPGFGIMTDGTVLQYSIDGSMKWTCSPCGRVTCFMVGGSYSRVDWLQS